VRRSILDRFYTSYMSIITIGSHQTQSVSTARSRSHDGKSLPTQCDGSPRVSFATGNLPSQPRPSFTLRGFGLRAASVENRDLPPRTASPLFESTLSPSSSPSCTIQKQQCPSQWERFKSSFKNHSLTVGGPPLDILDALVTLGYFPDTGFFSRCPETQLQVLNKCIATSPAIQKLLEPTWPIERKGEDVTQALQNLRSQLGCDFLPQMVNVYALMPPRKEHGVTRDLCANDKYGEYSAIDLRSLSHITSSVRNVTFTNIIHQGTT